MNCEPIISELLKSDEPSIRWKVRVNVLGEDQGSKEIRNIQKEIRDSPRAKKLLSLLTKDGRIKGTSSIYAKWQGAHWILNTLADIGYPKDETLLPIRDQVFSFWLQPRYFIDTPCKTKKEVYQLEGIPVMQGRHRTCASQQGNALFYLLKLELEDDRVHQLAERLLHWQWPDGGWNCDKDPSASTSTFIHTLWSIRGLSHYAKKFKDKKVNQAIERAVEVLLTRHLYKRKTNGKIIKREFGLLHYPLYWHYDFLAGLKVIAEAGYIHDLRCSDALDLLMQKRLPDSGWPAESRYYKTSNKIKLGNDFVDWGGTSKKLMNEWVTVDALYVLKEVGRI